MYDPGFVAYLTGAIITFFMGCTTWFNISKINKNGNSGQKLIVLILISICWIPVIIFLIYVSFFLLLMYIVTKLHETDFGIARKFDAFADIVIGK